MSLLNRIVGAITGAPPKPRTQILSDTHAAVPPAEERSRQRGNRGGRGRNGNGASNSTASPPNRAPAPRYDDRRGRPDGPGPRWRPSRDSLDAPLPEDVAFRPASNGGDSSILPVNRRPPPGARRPGRVFYAGTSAQYVARDDAPPPPPPLASRLPSAEVHELPPSEAHAEALADADGTEPAKRRRRGRRGGRGRRRPGDGTQNADGTSDTTGVDADSEADDLEDDDIEDEEESEVGEYATEDDYPDEPEVLVVARRPAAAPAARRPEREQAPVAAWSPSVAPGELPEAFAALGIGQRSLEWVARAGFATPTPIQERTIPILMNGHDVVGVAQTGTGKTLAFGIPMVERLDPNRRGVQALVLVPTRELAQQVFEVLRELGAFMGLDAVGLLGGHALDRDFQALERGPQIVVGTPGRIIDHLHRGTLSLADVRYAVLDEADQMLDIGFLPDITRILSRTPRARQTALFSATMPHAILRLVRRYMEDPETVAIAPQGTTVDSVQQIYFEVAQRDKVHGLHELIERELKGRTLVFSRTRRGVDYVADQLAGAGVRVGALHGDMEQRKRDQVVQRFREGALDVLIATNVAARGLDIPEITHVVNFDVPQNVEEYVHRIGRTGRAGREGKAITFVCERDVVEFDALLAAFGDRLTKEELNFYG